MASLWLIVDISIVTMLYKPIVTMVYKASYNLGAPPCRSAGFFLFFRGNRVREFKKIWFIMIIGDISIAFSGFVNQHSHHWGAPPCGN